jgi:hypothetical protein
MGTVAGVLEGVVGVGATGGFRVRPDLPLAGALWIPLTFAAAELARKVPWSGTPRLHFLLAHGAAAAAAAYVLNGAYFALGLLWGAVPPEAVVPATVAAGTRWLHLHAAGWVAVVAVIHVTDGWASGDSPRGKAADASAPSMGEPTLLVQRGRGGLQLPWSEIDWIEADGDYARVHVGDKTHLVSRRMRELEEELADPPFVRVHRSAIVNVGRVREVRHRSHGDFEAELSDGTVVRVSRTRRDGLLASMGGRQSRA